MPYPGLVPPISATPYPSPYPASAAPYAVSATPYGPPAPAPKLGPLGIAFAILAAFLLLAGAGMGVFLFNERSTQQSQITDLRSQVEDLEDQLAERERDLRRAEGDIAELEECPEAIQAAVDAAAAGGGQVSQAQAALLSFELIAACGITAP